eukprot:7376663-Prymnesium_polylepis.1
MCVERARLPGRSLRVGAHRHAEGPGCACLLDSIFAVYPLLGGKFRGVAHLRVYLQGLMLRWPIGRRS